MAAPATAEPGAAKTYFRGTQRVVAPEVTLERLRPLLAPMGITRVGVLTGLDRVGLPVAMATRPNSRALAVSQGKGATVAGAKVSAIMEAAEGFHAETVRGPLFRAAAAELDGAVDPRALPRAAGGDDDDVERARLLWIAGVDLATGETRYVPFELVHTDYTVPLAEPARFQATTNGLAAGNVALEAQLHALYELIERDAVACWRARGGPFGGAGRALDLADLDAPELAPLVAQLAAAELELAVWDVTSDIGVAVCVALAAPRGAAATSEPELGVGCHLDPEVALARALSEAAQTRLTRISGARDDFEPSSYDQAPRARRKRDAAAWLARGGASALAWSRFAAAHRGRAAPDLASDLATVLEALARAGTATAVWVDLTRPELGLPVGRAVVPGLEGPWLPDSYVPGRRARGAGA